jgi:acyl carrier protein
MTGPPPRAPHDDDPWERFICGLAEISDRDQETITPDARVIEDLALDSLALAELIVFIDSELYARALDSGLDDRAWEGLTVRQLYDAIVPTNIEIRA